MESKTAEPTMYCPTCDSIVEDVTVDNLCVGCGDIVEWTGIAQAAERRCHDATVAKIRAWAVKQRDMCQQMRDGTGSDVEDWLRWRGSELAMDALISYLDNGLNDEVQS